MKKSIPFILIISMFFNAFLLNDLYQKYKRTNKLEEKVVFEISRNMYNSFDDLKYGLFKEDKYIPQNKEYKSDLVEINTENILRISHYYYDRFYWGDEASIDKKWVKDVDHIAEYFSELFSYYAKNKPLDKKGVDTLKEIVYKGTNIGTILDSAENYDKKYCDITPLENLKVVFSELGDMCKNEDKRLSKLRNIDN